MYRAITEYALFGADPQLSGTLNALFALMRPNIDSSNRKRDAGKKGGDVGAGGAPAGNRNAVKPNNSKSKANQEQINSDIEIEEEKEIEKELKKETDAGKGVQGENLTSHEYFELHKHEIGKPEIFHEFMEIRKRQGDIENGNA